MFTLQRSLSSQNAFPYRRASAGQSTTSQHHNQRNPMAIQRSSSATNCVIINKRGFKPSDRFDPAKRDFLLNLSKQIWQRVSTT